MLLILPYGTGGRMIPADPYFIKPAGPAGRRLWKTLPCKRHEQACNKQACIVYLYNLPNLGKFVNIFIKNLPKNSVCDIIIYWHEQLYKNRNR